MTAVARRGSALGYFGINVAESFSNTSSGLMSPLGIGCGNGHMSAPLGPSPLRSVVGGIVLHNTCTLPTAGGSGIWQASSCGAVASVTAGGSPLWVPPAGPVRSDCAFTAAGYIPAMSSPMSFLGEAAAGSGGADSAAAAAASNHLVASRVGGGGSSGLIGRGFVLVPTMSSLSVPAPVDVVTMGLDSADLLDVMEYEAGAVDSGLEAVTVGSPESGGDVGDRCGSLEDVIVDSDVTTRCTNAMLQQQPKLQAQSQQVSGARAGGTCWPTSKVKAHNAGGRIRTLPRL